MDEMRKAILDRVTARMTEIGMTWGTLAGEIDRQFPEVFESPRQTVENWKSRGVPPSRHTIVATVLGWSTAELLGESDPGQSAWPFPNVAAYRFHRLSPSQRLAVESAILSKLEEIEAQAGARSKSTRGVPDDVGPVDGREIAS